MLIPNCNPNLVVLHSTGFDDNGVPSVDRLPIIGWVVEPEADSAVPGGAIDKARPVVVGELVTFGWAIHDQSSGLSWTADGGLCGPSPSQIFNILAEQAAEYTQEAREHEADE